ncbi:MAG: protein kinase [Deltaproteobacteria bacterium]|nr:protein kinase [Deltaproteobacteria bacterium]
MSLGLPPTPDPVLRICPQCGAETRLAECLKDGFATVERARYVKRQAHERAGEVLAGRWRLDAVMRVEPLACVYRATDTRGPSGQAAGQAAGRAAGEQAAVVVRLLVADVGASLERIARFQREGRFLGALQHPGIVRVYEHGVAADGTLFVAEELVTGERLDAVIARGPMEADDVIALGRVLFEALAEVHARGLQHRSLSLHDVWWRRDGAAPKPAIKVGGFGWVKILADEQPAFTFPRELGHAFSTMAPEQARGKGVSGHADLYSAGAILYAALTGALPFGEGTPSDLLVAHAVKMPRPPERDGQPLTGPLVELVMRCLEKKPWNRPDGAQAALDALERLAGRPFQHAGPAAFADTPAPTSAELDALQKRRAVSTVERRAERPALPLASAPVDAPRIVRSLKTEPVALPEPARTRELTAAQPGLARGTWGWVVAVLLAIGGGIAVGMLASEAEAPLPTPMTRLTENTLVAGRGPAEPIGIAPSTPAPPEPALPPEPSGPAPPAEPIAPGPTAPTATAATRDLSGLTALAEARETVVRPPPAWPAPKAEPAVTTADARAPVRPEPARRGDTQAKRPAPKVDDPFADLEDPSIAPQARVPAVTRKVLVDSDPPGASVSIDGRPAGKTPLYVEWDDVGGSVDIRLDKTGFRTIATSLGPRTGRAVFLVLKALDAP